MKELEFIFSSPDPDSGAVKILRLDHAPDGWDDAAIEWERSLTYWGLSRSFSMQVKWVKESAEFIRRSVYMNGCRAEVDVTVKKLNKKTLNYMIVYEGKIDMATFKDCDNYVEATLIDGGLSEIVKDHGNDEFDFIPGIYGGGVMVHPAAIVKNPIDGTFALAYFPWTIAWRLFDKMTEFYLTYGHYGFKSSLLEKGGYWYDKLLITTGKAWRIGRGQTDQSIPEVEFPIKTTFNDFFNSLNMLLPIGLGIEEIDGKKTFVLEEASYFFNENQIIDVGEVSGLQVGYIQDFLVDKINLTYPEKDIDDESYTAYEPNSYLKFRNYEHNFGSSSAKELECKYRADYAGLSYITNVKVPDDDDGWDEDIWFLEVQKKSTVVELYNMAKGSVTHDIMNIGAEWYNCLLSPRRCLKRGMDFYRDWFYRLVNTEFVYLSGGYNNSKNYVSDPYDGGVGTLESSGVKVNGEVKIKPLEITFEAVYQCDFIDLVNNFHDRYIQFWYEGNPYWGYFKKMSVKLCGKGSTKFTLISHVKSPVQNLIR